MNGGSAACRSSHRRGLISRTKQTEAPSEHNSVFGAEDSATLVTHARAPGVALKLPRDSHTTPGREYNPRAMEI